MITLSVDTSKILKLAEYLKQFMKQQDKALYETALVIAKEIEKLLLEPTLSWKHKPKINVEVKKYSFGYRVNVVIDDDIYFYVNFGTRPHQIFGGKGVLRFSPSIPKTTPNSLFGSAGSGMAGNYIFARHIYHPGITPRRFDNVARQKLNTKLPGIINNKMHRFWQTFFRGFI